MRHTVDLRERIRGHDEQVPAILRLDVEHIIREPLEELRVQVGQSSIGRRVKARVGPPHPVGPPRGLCPRTLEIPLQWKAAEHARLFPTMHGVLSLTGSGPHTIELRLLGDYTTPWGPVGALADRVAGHDAVAASLRGYLVEVARRLEDAIRQFAPAATRGRRRIVFLF